MRLFIAIKFTEQVNKLLLDSIDQLIKQTVSAKPTYPENLHLTLAFIGESNKIKEICDIINQSVPKNPFSITLENAGNFRDLWWIGVENTRALNNLALNLQSNLYSAGFRIKSQKLTPHITIARKVISNKSIHLKAPSASMIVDSISLMKSEYINGKLTYTEIYKKLFN